MPNVVQRQNWSRSLSAECGQKSHSGVQGHSTCWAIRFQQFFKNPTRLRFAVLWLQTEEQCVRGSPSFLSMWSWQILWPAGLRPRDYERFYTPTVFYLYVEMTLLKIRQNSQCQISEITGLLPCSLYKKCDGMFSGFHTMQEYDRQTDTQTGLP